MCVYMFTTAHNSWKLVKNNMQMANGSISSGVARIIFGYIAEMGTRTARKPPTINNPLHSTSTGGINNTSLSRLDYQYNAPPHSLSGASTHHRTMHTNINNRVICIIIGTSMRHLYTHAHACVRSPSRQITINALTHTHKLKHTHQHRTPGLNKSLERNTPSFQKQTRRRRRWRCNAHVLACIHKIHILNTAHAQHDTVRAH